MGPGIDLNKQFGWLADLQKSAAMPQPSPTAPLASQIEFMLLGWKQVRCLSPLRHGFERCPGYHVVQHRANSASPIFDARRPPIKEGRVLYHAETCQQRPQGREGSPSHYYSCAAGSQCGYAHSLVEMLYNPGGWGLGSRA